MRVKRGDTTWTMYPTTRQEQQIFAAIASRLAPGELFHCNAYNHDSGRLLITAGGNFHHYRTRQPNCTECVWIGGINLPLTRPADPEFDLMIRTMRTYGLTYVGSTGGGLEVFGALCILCGGRILDAQSCVYQVCAPCVASCEHLDWKSGVLVGTADDGLAIGEQCTRCKLKRGPATDDTAGVERTTGIMVVGPDFDPLF